MTNNAFYLYMSINEVAAISVLVNEENRAEGAVYFVSKVFTQVEMRYL